MSRRHLTALVPLASLAACLAGPAPARDDALARDGAPTDTSADVEAGDAQPADQQLLANPDFEGGMDGWLLEGTAMIGEPAELGVSFQAASGDVFAQVGRRDSVQNGISQALTVPAWATSLRLSGQHCFVTNDSDTTRDDVVSLFLLDAEGVELETLLTASNAEIGGICNWTGFSLTAAASHAGEEIQIALVATADGSEVTAFWFDDLELVASAE
jgi:hypothetical protein